MNGEKWSADMAWARFTDEVASLSSDTEEAAAYRELFDAIQEWNKEQNTKYIHSDQIEFLKTFLYTYPVLCTLLQLENKEMSRTINGLYLTAGWIEKTEFMKTKELTTDFVSFLRSVDVGRKLKAIYDQEHPNQSECYLDLEEMDVGMAAWAVISNNHLVTKNLDKTLCFKIALTGDHFFLDLVSTVAKNNRENVFSWYLEVLTHLGNEGTRKGRHVKLYKHLIDLLDSTHRSVHFRYLFRDINLMKLKWVIEILPENSMNIVFEMAIRDGDLYRYDLSEIIATVSTRTKITKRHVMYFAKCQSAKYVPLLLLK